MWQIRREGANDDDMCCIADGLTLSLISFIYYYLFI